MNEVAALPSPRVLLSRRLERYYGRLRLPPRLATRFPALHPFHGLRPDDPGSAPPLPHPKAGGLTTRQASRDATDRSVASPNGAFDAGLRPGPLPDRAASLLPGLLAATRTGLTPAGDDELMFGSGHPSNHLRNAGHTSQFPQKATRKTGLLFLAHRFLTAPQSGIRGTQVIKIERLLHPDHVHNCIKL